MNYALIVAGGTGTRFSSNENNHEQIPKQFVNVNGKPVICYTVDHFQASPTIDQIVIVCLESYMGEMEALRNKYGYDKVTDIVPGGATFMDSFMRGVEALKGRIQDEDILVMHAAVSPFVTEEIIADSVRVAKQYGNAVSSVDCAPLCGVKQSPGSIKAPGSYCIEGAQREWIALMTIPQTFRYDLLRTLFAQAEAAKLEKEEIPYITDIMYALGYKVYFSKGSQLNVKITNYEDLQMLEAFSLLWDRGTGPMFHF